MEDTNAIQEASKFIWCELVPLVMSRPFYIVHGVIHLPILVVALGQARLVHVARLLLLLLFSSIEGHLLSQSVFVGDSQHHFRCPRILHGELAGQG
jgi:hypothetical protein